MSFHPIRSSDEIVNYFRNYLLTTYRTSDPVYNKQLQEKIDHNRLAKGPFITLSDPYKQAKTLTQLADEGIVARSMSLLSALHPQRPLYSHQEDSIRKAADDKNLIITTGTGSGKTECFLIPIINHLLKQREAGTLGSGVRALLIYPMNALVNDQMRRLRELFKDSSIDDIYFAKFTGETKGFYNAALKKYKQLNDDQEPIVNELISREQIREKKPHILITNYAMLEYLLLRPDDNVIFANDNADTWKFIVFDEAHSYNGAKGIEVSNLIKRLKATLNRQDIQFLLTSATLGDDDEKIVNFGKLLCSAPFGTDGIIRSETVPPKPSKKPVPISWEEYNKIAERLSDPTYSSSQEEMVEIYDRVRHDPFLVKVRDVLLGKTLEVEKVIDRLGTSEEDFANFIMVATHGQKEGMRIFEARYHMFIRGIDGAYITIAPDEEKQLFVDKMTSYQDDNGKVPCYEITFCNQCHANFIVGEIEGNHLVQKKHGRNDKNLKVFLLSESVINNDNEDDEKKKDIAYLLCGRCGKIHEANSLDKLCEHNEKYHQRIIKLKSSSTCPCCQSQNKSRSITRPYMLGVDSATAVLATALYREMPEQDKGKRFLCFSDSRQAAAYFSSYLQDTYNDNLKRRLLAMCCDEFHDTLKEGMRLSGFRIKLENRFNEYFENAERESSNCICKELCHVHAGNSLLANGYIYMDVDFSQMGKLPSIDSFKDEQVKQLIRILIYVSFVQSRSLQVEHSTYYSDYSGVSAESWQGKGSKRGRKVENIIKYFFKRLKDEDCSTERSNEYAQQIWYFLENEKIIKKYTKERSGKERRGNEGKYYLVDNKLLIKAINSLYECPRCHHLYIHHIEGLCHNPRCVEKGIIDLKEVNFIKNTEFQHYKDILKEFPTRNMQVEEHTAQIDKDDAYQLQQDFEKGNINVLSCSTTFEMGIDVGTLDTVFMRNMPPTPANYAQRAGRAGRSLQSIAYAITYSSNGSHDTHYFREPANMIKGDILPPNFDIANEKIIQRHIFASAFAFFWKAYPAHFNDNKLLGDFLNNKIHIAFIEYLKNYPSDLCKFLKEIVTDKKLSENTFGISKFKWLDFLCLGKENEEGVLGNACNQFQKDISSLGDLLDECDKEIKNATVAKKKALKWKRDKIDKTKSTLENIKILDFLSRNNLIPKYSFPVDTVELTIAADIPNKKEAPKYNLQRDLFMAISEYAPDSEIVVGKKLLTSRYIKRSSGLEWLKYSFFKCRQCNCLNSALKGIELDRACKNCGEVYNHKSLIEDFIIPRFGFIAENEIKDVGLNKPERSYNGEISYIGSNSESIPRIHELGRYTVEVISKSHDELAVLNTSNFEVCEACGFAKKVEVSPTRGEKCSKMKHIDSRGFSCSGLLTSLRLGHTFKTDVACITFKDIFLNNHEQAWTILYSLIEGLCHYLHITRTEIAGCLKKLEEGNYQFIIFDQTPGGAGYVKQLDQLDCFKGMISRAQELVESCECGGVAQDTACYSCLCNYYNQAHHDILKRHYALKFFNDFFYENALEQPASVLVEADRHNVAAHTCKLKHEKGTGTDLSSCSSISIWQNLSDELKPEVLEELCSLSDMHAPLSSAFFHAELSLHDTFADKRPRLLDTAFIWPDAHCILLYSQSDCSEIDCDAIRNAGWSLFTLDADFCPERLIEIIKKK